MRVRVQMKVTVCVRWVWVGGCVGVGACVVLVQWGEGRVSGKARTQIYTFSLLGSRHSTALSWPTALRGLQLLSCSSAWLERDRDRRSMPTRGDAVTGG